VALQRIESATNNYREDDDSDTKIVPWQKGIDAEEQV